MVLLQPRVENYIYCFQFIFNFFSLSYYHSPFPTSFSIGHDCIAEILAGIDNITEDITKEPETAGELVAFNFMMDTLEQRVVALEERLEYLRELYDLMGEFNLPIPPDDMTDYLGRYHIQRSRFKKILYLHSFHFYTD